jgi:hypothetical protein
VAELVVALTEERNADPLVEVMAAGARGDAAVLEPDPLVSPLTPRNHRGRLKDRVAATRRHVDDLTKKRLKHNEQLFREVNDAREEASPGSGDTVLSFVCECADRDCTDLIELSVAEYERIRQSPQRFIVIPGHVVPEIERVVEERGAFDVVEKDAA